MEVISSSAPYELTIVNTGEEGSGEYSIKHGVLSSSPVYKGKIYGNTSGVVTTTVDIQPILVNYLPSELATLHRLNDTSLGVIYGIFDTDFKVEYPNTSGSGTSSVELDMKYCRENATNAELNLNNNMPMMANDFIQRKYVVGSYISIMEIFKRPGSSTSEGITMEVKYTDGIVSVVSPAQTGLSTQEKTNRICGYVNIPTRTDSCGEVIYPSTIRFYRGSDALTPELELMFCVPDNTYILYYLNTFGAIDYIICDKKNTVEYNEDRHSMTRYANINDRTKHGKIDYLMNQTIKYKLNTDIMSDEQSQKMYRLFNSPYVWIYDFDKNRMESVNIVDKSLKIKKFETDRVYNYTITVESSQTFTIH